MKVPKNGQFISDRATNAKLSNNLLQTAKSEAVARSGNFFYWPRDKENQFLPGKRICCSDSNIFSNKMKMPPLMHIVAEYM